MPEGECIGEGEAAVEAEEGSQYPFAKGPMLVIPDDSAAIGVFFFFFF